MVTDAQIRVLVIGAGTAGIAAANHLRNYGHSVSPHTLTNSTPTPTPLQVRMLEASGSLGGRVRDNFSLGPCVGMGAMFITGICNNPFTLVAEQQGIPLRVVNEERCDLVTEREGKVEGEADLKVERHFNSTLDHLADWRAGQSKDCPLQSRSTLLTLLTPSHPHTCSEVG